MNRKEAKRQRRAIERREAMAKRTFLRAGEIAERWGVSVQTVHDAALPYLQPRGPGGVRLYHPDDVLEFEEAHTVRGGRE